MKNSAPPLKECPPYEELSACFDGEECAPGVKEHIAVCPVCTKKMEELKVLSGSIRENFPEADTAFPELICKKVRKSLKTARLSPVVKPDFNYAVFVRAAAFLILAGAFAFCVWDQNNGKTAKIPVRNVASSAMTQAVLSAVPAEKKTLSGVDVSDFSAVSFGPESALPELPGKKAQKWVAVPENVHHTWKLAPGTGEEKLSALVRKSGGHDFLLKKGDDGMLKVQFKSGKRECVQFVRNCRKAGNLLLSPGQPQPEQERFTGSADDPVTYTGEFYLK